MRFFDKQKMTEIYFFLIDIRFGPEVLLTLQFSKIDNRFSANFYAPGFKSSGEKLIDLECQIDPISELF